MRPTDDRAALQLADVVYTFFLVVALMGLSPVFYDAIGMSIDEADPFTALLLQLVFPLLLIAVIVSVGVAARRS